MSLAGGGRAKTIIQVGGVRPPDRDDSVISWNTLFGPTRDGRIKPDVVGPSTVLAGDWDWGSNIPNCNISTQGPGTSWSTPTIAGAAALVRQDYTHGLYAGGPRKAPDA